MIYPKKPKDEWRSIKIKEEDHKRINHLRWVEGVSVKQLSDIFKVGQWCIYYHIDPEYRKKMLKYGYVKFLNNHNDPEWKKHRAKLNTEWMNYSRINNPSFRKWLYRSYADRVSKNPLTKKKQIKRHREYQREYRKEHPQISRSTSNRQSRKNTGSFIRRFFNSLEPKRTKNEIHALQMKNWRLKNPEKESQIQKRYREKLE